VTDGALRCACGRVYPVIGGIARVLPADLAPSLLADHPAFFARHPDLGPPPETQARRMSLRTLHAFGDEWQRFPEIHDIHAQTFRWYFEGPEEVRWRGLRVLDAGCGMGRWLHFARQEGAQVVGMDVSPAIDVVARREGRGVDLVQADLRHPPFAEGTFDLVYSLGVVHHLEDPRAGVRALADLVRPGGELRLYVYRTLRDEHWLRRRLLDAVTLLRRATTRMPFGVVHAISFAIAVVATVGFLWPRRALRRTRWGDRLTRDLPLVQYADVPFRMLVAEQFDRLAAPLEGRFTSDEIAAWLEAVGIEVRAVLAGLGWRVIGRRPA
jgi:SAM-dependent methyltransferase